MKDHTDNSVLVASAIVGGASMGSRTGNPNEIVISNVVICYNMNKLTYVLTMIPQYFHCLCHLSETMQ